MVASRPHLRMLRVARRISPVGLARSCRMSSHVPPPPPPPSGGGSGGGNSALFGYLKVTAFVAVSGAAIYGVMQSGLTPDMEKVIRVVKGEKNFDDAGAARAEAAKAAPITQRAFMDLTVEGKPLGRVEIGLYGQDVPFTCKNFAALCSGEKGTGKSGKPLHFLGSTFHRIIPNFMAQGGDFTNGDGTGGESIYGSRFEDESFAFRHDGAGVLSMANSGPNTNRSQFFITFSAQPHLDGKHVVFGKVVEGLDVVREVEKLGTNVGTPRKTVAVAACGLLPATEADRLPPQEGEASQSKQ